MIHVRRVVQFRHPDDFGTWQFETAKQVALWMWGKDILRYEFSVGGVYHRFCSADIQQVARQVRVLAKVRRMMIERLLLAGAPEPATKLTWRDAMPQ